MILASRTAARKNPPCYATASRAKRSAALNAQEEMLARHCYDVEKGSNYNYFRDYDPSIGRYVESDPIGLRGGINTYGYVVDDPLASVDPSGRGGYIGGTVAIGGRGLAGGGGLTVMRCDDECGKGHKFLYLKICGGLGTSGGSALGGYVWGVNGKSCRPDRYSGYFLEISGGYWGGAGFDMGLTENKYHLPNGFSGVNELGGGFSTPGASGLLCYYFFLGEI